MARIGLEIGKKKGRRVERIPFRKRKEWDDFPAASMSPACCESRESRRLITSPLELNVTWGSG